MSEDRLMDVADVDGMDEGNLSAGVVKELGELGAGAVITEAGLARLLGRHKVSIKRAVERGELPPPIRLCGGPVWLAGAIIEHLQKRMDEAAKEREKVQRRISDLCP